MSAKRFNLHDPRKVCASKIQRYRWYTLYMCTTQCMIGSVFTSGVCVCVCVFRMLFEKPVLLTADHWYTHPHQEPALMLGPLDRTREVQYIQHMYICMYIVHIHLHVCTHNVYLMYMYTSYLSSSISRYMYMYKTL